MFWVGVKGMVVDILWIWFVMLEKLKLRLILGFCFEYLEVCWEC